MLLFQILINLHGLSTPAPTICQGERREYFLLLGKWLGGNSSELATICLINTDSSNPYKNIFLL